MKKLIQTQVRVEVLPAAVLALCAALPPARAGLVSRMFKAALSDLDDGGIPDADTDAAVAATAAVILATLER